MLRWILLCALSSLVCAPKACGQANVYNQLTRTAAETTDSADVWIPIWDQPATPRKSFKISVAELFKEPRAIVIASGSLTDSAPAMDITQTFNDGTEAFTAFRLNVTDTASAAGSLLADLQVGGSTKFNVNKAGNVVSAGTIAAVGSVSGTKFTASNTVTADSPAFDAAQTWNNAGVTFSGMKLNITDTASNAASKLLDLQVGGVSKLKVTPDGALTASYFITDGSGGAGIYVRSTNNPTVSLGSSDDVVLTRDAADTLAQRRGLTAQKSSIYNTWANSGTDYERFVIDWKGTANTARIGTEMGGTGVARPVSIITGGTERLGIAANSVATFTFDTGLVANGFLVKGTNGTTYATIGSGGVATTNQMVEIASLSSTAGRLNIGAGQCHVFNEAGNLSVITTYGDLSIRPGGLGGGGTTIKIGASGDVGITRPAASILGITNGSTGPGVLAVDNVQGTDFERMKMEWASNVARIGTSIGGSGTAREFAIITNDVERVKVRADAGSVSITGGTITTSSKPLIDSTSTWNDAGVTFTAFKQNITDTASGVNSLLFDWQVGGSSYLKLTKFGDLVGSAFTGTDFSVRLQNGSLKQGSSSITAWGSGNAAGSMDTGLARAAAGIVKFTNASTGAGMIQLQEVAAEPAAPAADNVVIYAIDNGSGKTQLMAKFSSGAAQEIAIAP